MPEGCALDLVENAPSGVTPSWRADEAVARHGDVFEAAPCGIVVVDRAGSIVDVNARALRDLRYERADLVGKSVETLVPDAQRKEHASARVGFCPGSRHSMGAGRHLMARRRDGTTFPAEVALSAVGDGLLAAFIVDLTAQRRAEEALEQRDAQLRLADKLASLGTLAAGVAHEINNPLAVIFGNLAFLAPEAGGTYAREGFRDMEHAAERIRAVVTDLRRFSGHEADAVPARVDVRRVLDVSLRMVGYATARSARIVRAFEDVPLVDAIASRMEQVFVNLLINAAYALGGERAADGEIRVRTFTGADGNAVVEIADTGCGMSEETRQHIFEPFFTTKPLGVGTGLGLSICARIVRDAGGTIAVESQLGHGTTVRVILPPSQS